jgi:tetratricopeptide (TPR) repeat protein
VAEEALERFPRHIPPEDWSIGVSPWSWYSIWRGFDLTWMGRLPEALEELGRCRRLAEEDGTPEMVGYALSFTSELHYLAHDAERLRASARQLEEINTRLGEHPVMVAHTQHALALARLAAGRAADAIEPARIALDVLGRVEKQHAGRTAWILAEALLASGDFGAAQSAAEQAIALCRRSLRGNFEAMAHGVLARTLLRRDGSAARDTAEAALAAAAALIERTGAKTISPALCEWRAELAGVLGDDAERVRLLHEAQRIYAAIGAPKQAERLLPEIRS